MDIMESAIQHGHYIVDHRPTASSLNTLFRKIDMPKLRKLPLLDLEKKLIATGLGRLPHQSREDFILKNTELYKNYLK